MRARLFTIFSVVIVLVGMLGMTSTAQAGAYGATFTSSITYQNLGSASATVHVDFYDSSNPTSPIPIDLPALPSLAGASLFLGSVSSIGAGFSGSAVMSSDQPMAVTIVQVPAAATGIKSRPLTNGISSGDVFVQIPTVLKNTFGFTSVFSVQNASSSTINVTVNFIPLGGGATVKKTISNLPVGAGQTYDLGQMSDWPTFNGSVQISATDVVVATDIEYEINGNRAYGFEGAGTGAPTYYIPSAFCKYGSTSINSSYAVQNTNAAGGSNVQVTVSYTNGVNTYVEPAVTISAGAKSSFPGCGKSGTLVPAGFIGSATITATGGNIVAIAKISDATLGTAFLGFTDAPSKVALPYVRYADNAHWFAGSQQRTFIAIQNIGPADLAAGAVTVKYYDKNGTLQGTDTLGAIKMGAKVSSNAANAGLMGFGFYSDNTAGGSAIVQGPTGSKLAVIGRVSTYLGGPGGPSAGEDYNGVPAP